MPGWNSWLDRMLTTSFEKQFESLRSQGMDKMGMDDLMRLNCMMTKQRERRLPDVRDSRGQWKFCEEAERRLQWRMKSACWVFLVVKA